MRPACKMTLLLCGLFASACSKDPSPGRAEAGVEAGPAETGKMDPPETNPTEVKAEVIATEAGVPEVKAEVGTETGEWEGGRQGCQASLEELRRLYAKFCPETISGPITALPACDHPYDPNVEFGLCDGVRTLQFEYGTRYRACSYDASGKLVSISATDDTEHFCNGKSGTIGAGLGISCHRRQLAERTKVTCQDRDGGARD